MSREQSLYAIVHSVARFQEEIADILDAKATEAEKARNWITLHMLPHTLDGHTDRLRQALDIHEQMVEVIDGLAKMEHSLGAHLKLLIGPEEKEAAAGGALGGLEGFGGGLFGGLGGK
ncbi:restriction endonuclease subunit S [Paenibacillus chartarius]|uniref:Restriction endonuclease subunit S n=1 Tax=Paenibacillus chartarius TaxID=747481 RepID=A0ABV6DJ76_9BACL